MKRVEYVEIGRAELKVDCYAGATCDEHKPGWEAHMEGDMESERGMAELTLGANAFRPGTKVIITEPVCPECDYQREMCELDEDCDFDWRKWDEWQYA